MPIDVSDQILARWKQAFRQYAELKASAENSVVRWEWADNERYNPLPFYFKLSPPRGRALKSPPTKRAFYYLYGLDENGRPRLHRFYDYLKLDGPYRLERDRQAGFEHAEVDETFYVYGSDRAEIIAYSIPPRIPLGVQQIEFDHGQVKRHTSLRLNGYTPLYSQKGKDPQGLYDWLGPMGRFWIDEEYSYRDGRLDTIRSTNEAPGAGMFRAEKHFTYDAAGSLARIEQVHEDGTRRLLYRKRERGQTFSSLRAAATEKMVAAISARLRTAEIDEQLYCIELAYRAVSHHFPPALVLGLESERQARLAAQESHFQASIFAPGLMGPQNWLEINDPETLEICAQLEQEVQAGEKWHTATQILRQVAAELTRHDWTGILNTTPDFVVFAIDWEMEGDRLAEVLGASAAPEQIRAWKRKGWL